MQKLQFIWKEKYSIFTEMVVPIKRLATAAICILILLYGVPACANVTYYTFEGPIYQVDDVLGAVAAAGLYPGSIVRYTFAVDYEAPGYVTNYDGVTYNLTDSPDYFNWFYDDLVSGDYLETVPGTIYDGLGIEEYNHGNYRPNQNWTFLAGDSFDDQVLINGAGCILDWYEGQDGFGGWETAGFASSPPDTPTMYYSYIQWNNLILVEISDTPPSAIPAPSVIILGSIGAGIVGWLRRRRAI